MTKLFNGTFETLLRVLLILSVKGRITIDRILEYEFMATYGREFGISEENLHGNNNFNFAEISIRRIYLGENKRPYRSRISLWQGQLIFII